MLSVEIIPALKDNYIYFLKDVATGKTAIMDPSEAPPVLKFIESRKEKVDFILITHHHWDHVNGNLEVKAKTHCKIAGFKPDAKRIPGIDIQLKENEVFSLGESKAKVLFIPGHTTGHLAYYFEREGILFCADTLFSLGCGRLFEGTAEQMFLSLKKIQELPPETKLYPAHEYTLANCDFALMLTPHDPELQKKQKEIKGLRAKNLPTLPVILEEEKRLNPFLKAKTVAEFAALRTQKDSF